MHHMYLIIYIRFFRKEMITLMRGLSDFIWPYLDSGSKPQDLHDLFFFLVDGKLLEIRCLFQTQRDISIQLLFLFFNLYGLHQLLRKCLALKLLNSLLCSPARLTCLMFGAEQVVYSCCFFF